MTPAERDDQLFPGALATHVSACGECQAQPPPLERIVRRLNAGRVELDAALLSQRALARLRPELERRAAIALWKNVVAAVLLASIPLPAVLLYDSYLLQLMYDVVRTVLPAAFAAYLVFTYGAFLTLLFASTYAAVPLLMARHHGRSTSMW